MGSDMAKVNKFGLMAEDMRENFKMASFLEKESSILVVELRLKAILKEISNMEVVRKPG